MAEGEPSDDNSLTTPEEWQKFFEADRQRSLELYRNVYLDWFAKIDLSSITVDEGFITRLTEWKKDKP